MMGMKAFKAYVRERYSTPLHKGEGVLHIFYCGAVYVEGHGIYAATGGALGVVCLIMLLLGDDSGT